MGLDQGVRFILLKDIRLLRATQDVLWRGLESSELSCLRHCGSSAALQVFGVLSMQSVVNTYFFLEGLKLDPGDVYRLSIALLFCKFRLGLLDRLDHLSYWHPLIF